MQIFEDFGRGTPDFPVSIYTEDREEEQQMVYLADPHWHHEVEMLYMQNGTAELFVGSEAFVMKAGEIYFLNPDELHAFRTHTYPMRYQAVVFEHRLLSFPEGHFFEENFTGPLRRGEIVFPRCIRPGDAQYEEILEAMKAVCRGVGASKYHSLTAIMELASILIEKGLMQEAKPRSVQTDKVRRCIRYMEEHYSEQITLKEMAERVHFTPNYLCNCFKSETGSSPFAVLNRIRIRHAAMRLKSTKEKVVDIAGACGFDSMSFFIKKFKETMGMSPSTYRKENEKGGFFL